ncbi:Bug family tripartite tricarboxylate transporter substrate binding protein [Rhodoplanes sp. Z2-YC6860]|uniref:Bug family tripartite tricarboxylate transporter substrate binding protein n=1 Tax=Rhodoplanes sp. Z2-YC6860 TaxID=674703 RepID=UPI00078DF9CF|nr:tripartite tricarboxylate transporter substrate binding protein [Rhodoplanes sp. Z2-YC6860]AMN44205.1 TTT family tricarboxylate transporter, receptor protein [Rhodoplanes sp. Z2-YC6860]
MLRFAVAVLLSALALGDASAQANWPQRGVKFVIPLGPGAGVDITARLLSDRLAQKWGQAVVVENRPGGDGVVALSSFIAGNDDHTLLMSPTSSFTHHPWMHDKMPYDAKELVPLVRMTNTLVAVVVPASSPYASLKELIADAKAHPGKLNWATITGFFDFMFEGFQKREGVVITKVPYRNTVQAAQDLAEGRIQMMMAAYAIVRPLVQAGKLKVLAFTASQRAAAVPDVPTAAEAGFPGMTIDGLVGVFGMKNLDEKARARIEADVIEQLRDPKIIETLTSTGQVVNPGTAKEFAAAIEAQTAQAAETGKLLGIKAAQ